MLVEINIFVGTFETYVGSSSLCVQGESCREAAGALISSIADACDVAQRRAQGCSLGSLQPQQKPFGATCDRWSDPLCELACVLRSRCTQSDEEPKKLLHIIRRKRWNKLLLDTRKLETCRYRLLYHAFML